MMYPGTRRHGKSPRTANASETPGFRCAPETAPMNRMIAITISPGATTAAGRLIWPLPCRIPPPAATSTRKNVPSSSENNRRYSSLGSSNCVREPNSSVSRRCARSAVVERERRFLLIGRGMEVRHAPTIPARAPTVVMRIG